MDFDAIRRPFEPALRRVLHVYWRFSRGLTLGVRGVIFDAQGRVFLIKHSYVTGWHLPAAALSPAKRSARRFNASCARKAISN